MKTVSIIAPIIFLALQGQESNQAYVDQLNRFSGNKLVLVGEWSAEDLSKWNKMLDSEDLSEYDFRLLGRSNQLWTRVLGADLGQNITLRGLETWISQQSGVLGSRWVAFDGSNRVITSGINIPEAKTLSSAMERFGIRSTLRQLRNFLMEHPDHIDARADLLKEARRRALLAAPKDAAKDLDTGDDLRTWGVLAREFDLAMNLNWVGFKLDFFRPEENQPEHFSPLMKTAFRKHMGRVEAAIREFPANENLWDMWAWMSRTLGDWGGRPIFQFVKSLEASSFSAKQKCPPPKVAAWLTGLAKSRGDWGTVAELASIGRSFDSNVVDSIFPWHPRTITVRRFKTNIPGYPVESAHYPLIEALLKLGRIDEANDAFDELIRATGTKDAQGAAAIAKSSGFEELAEAWSKGVMAKPVPYYRLPGGLGKGQTQVVASAEYGSPEYQQIREILDDIKPRLEVHYTWDKKTLGWTGDDLRWALIDGDGLVITQGAGMPGAEELQKAISENNIKTDKELAEEFLQNNPDNIEALITFGINSIHDSLGAVEKANSPESLLSADQDYAVWGKTVSSWAKILDHENALFAVPTFYAGGDTQSASMKALSRRYLPKIETAVRQSPSSDALWSLWLFWRRAGGREREFEQMLESIAPSPMALNGTCPPGNVLNEYYRECEENNLWPQMIKLLRDPWDREISRQIAENDAKARTNEKPNILFAQLGDDVGFPLIKALLQAGRRQEADEIFKVWLDCGGSFSNPADLVELARKFGGERLAVEWGEKMKR